jgi:hypothetical protein
MLSKGLLHDVGNIVFMPLHDLAHAPGTHPTLRVQTEDEAIRQDCLEAIHAVTARFGEFVEDPWPLVEVVLKEMQSTEGSHQKKALNCICAHSLSSPKLSPLCALLIFTYLSPLCALLIVTLSVASVGDHEYVCMHLMIHLRDEPQARYSNAFDI